MAMSATTRHLLSSFFVLLVSCTSVEQAPPTMSVAQAPVIQENLGEQVARHLTTRYADTRENCGADSKPAFLCNGVMIRATVTNPTYHVWENSPASIAKGGVSFSYLRSDLNVRQMVFDYTNGFIFQSYSHVTGKTLPEILCSFPVDGWTASRSDAGCGPYPGYAGSGACHLKSVTTGAQWWADFNSHASYRGAWQCGFDVRDSRNILAGPAFAASLNARSYLSLSGSERYNEIILKAWANNLGKTLPLEAFFYLAGTNGLSDAQRNQRDLKNTDGVVIPIISVRLPTATVGGTFYYIAGDQTQAMPPAGP